MYLSLCLIAKDENTYLKEWLDYHILFGVEHFWIYDNDSTVPLAESISDYIQKGWVTCNTIHGKGRQLFAYDHCLQTYGHYSRWIGFIDTDEFILPKTGKDIPEFLRDFEQYGGLALSSLFFGPGGNQNRPRCGQVAGYLMRTPEELSKNRSVKAIIQPEKVMFPVSPHSFMFREGYYCVNEQGSRVDTQYFPCSVQKIQLNHYYTRSAQEWKDKLSRGRGDMGDAYSNQRWIDISKNSTVRDEAAPWAIIHHLKLPPARARNFAALTDPTSTQFLGLMSTAAESVLPPPCNAAPVEEITDRKEMVDLIKDLLDGMDYMGSGRFLEARQLYSRLIRQFPHDLNFYGNFASACIEMKDFPAAWEALAQGWRMSPRNWTLLFCMVDYFYAIGDYAQAEKCSYLIQSYGNLEPLGVAALALSQWKQGKKEQAMETARLLLPQLTPELASSHVLFQEMVSLMNLEGKVGHDQK
ncbi:glycosyltransferase family 92 protein [Leptolinea tardivitalis]|uniref:glycosyltransferase family 92 protein n=1 Tax=Leptolinea tardivitalis TaxID=229920 RepID=UPI000780B672|nr:glycosyltransferase family 92 protein [Leptolinea tardivitalis]GAP22513.1 glycosyltransferase family 92 [Leptolinea tardivitalis]